MISKKIFLLLQKMIGIKPEKVSRLNGLKFPATIFLQSFSILVLILKKIKNEYHSNMELN